MPDLCWLLRYAFPKKRCPEVLVNRSSPGGHREARASQVSPKEHPEVRASRASPRGALKPLSTGRFQAPVRKPFIHAGFRAPLESPAPCEVRKAPRPVGEGFGERARRSMNSIKHALLFLFRQMPRNIGQHCFSLLQDAVVPIT